MTKKKTSLNKKKTENFSIKSLKRKKRLLQIFLRILFRDTKLKEYIKKLKEECKV